jgi:phage tail-like protein
MPSHDEEPLLRASSFEVLIGDRELGFAHVSRLSSETEGEGARDPRTDRLATLVLKRALTASSDLFEWRRSIVAGKDDRRDVTIRLLSGPGGRVVNVWRLVGAWPCRWSGPTFDALNNDIAWEELELAYDDLEWLTPDTNPGG